VEIAHRFLDVRPGASKEKSRVGSVAYEASRFEASGPETKSTHEIRRLEYFFELARIVAIVLRGEPCVYYMIQ